MQISQSRLDEHGEGVEKFGADRRRVERCEVESCGIPSFAKSAKDGAPAKALTLPIHRTRLANMEVNFRPETESRLQELASKSGRPPSELIEDAMAGYLLELSQVREMLDSRYDDLKSGRVQPVDGEEAFAKLRQKSKNDARRAGS